MRRRSDNVTLKRLRLAMQIQALRDILRRAASKAEPRGCPERFCEPADRR
jgi:hypothetical protein